MKSARIFFFILGFLLLRVAANAQVESDGTGTAGTIPIYANPNYIGSSHLFQDFNTGNIGLATTSPAYTFDIRSNSWSNAVLNLQTINPGTNFEGVFLTGDTNTWAMLNLNSTNGGDYPGAFAVWTANGGKGLLLDASGNEYFGICCNNGLVSMAGLSVLNNKNVGVATSTPGADLVGTPANPAAGTAVLDVNGDIELAQGGTGEIIFPDGTVQSTAYISTSCPVADLASPHDTVIAVGGDYAESVDVNGDRSSYEPGDVIIIDPKNPEHFIKSNTPYSTLVAGIYSTKPGYVGRRQISDPKVANSEIPMAMIGVVPTKVTTENGPIKTGDLLVTSSTAGYAMKGTDRMAMTGAIVGKALGELRDGKGAIEVLVTLQ